MQQGGSIGGGIGAFARYAKQQGRTFARHNEPIRFRFACNCQRVGSLQLSDGRARGGKKVRCFSQFEGNQVRHHLGIRIRSEDEALALQPNPQGFVILDDAVMYDSQSAGNMRMRVTFARHAVRRPTRMRNTSVSLGFGLFGLRRQFSHPAHGAQTLQPPFANQRQSGRIVAAIFKPAQPMQENGNDVAVRDRRDDATHDLSRMK